MGRRKVGEAEEGKKREIEWRKEEEIREKEKIMKQNKRKEMTRSEDLKIEKVQRKNLLQGFWQDWRTSKNKIEIFSEVTSSQEEERSMKEEEKENLSDVSNGGSTCSSKDKNEKIAVHKEATIRQVEDHRLHCVEEAQTMIEKSNLTPKVLKRMTERI